MGQYYRPCYLNNTKDNVLEFFSPYDTENGAKLMEHSYVGNALVVNVTYKMIGCPKRLVWAGDYADAVVGDDNFYYLTDKAKKVESSYEIAMMKHELERNTIYINHNKMEWFDLKKQTIPDMKGWSGIAHPLPILTADGNGRGGGDYNGAHEKLVGTWKGDLIEVSDTIPANYKEIEPWFTEMSQEEIDEYFKELEKPNKEEQVDALKKLCDMDNDEFNKFMRSIGLFEETEYVDWYNPMEIGEIIEDANNNGYSININIEILHDEYIHVKYIDNPYCKSCVVNGLGDNNEEWCEYFKLEKIAQDYEKEIIKF